MNDEYFHYFAKINMKKTNINYEIFYILRQEKNPKYV